MKQPTSRHRHQHFYIKISRTGGKPTAYALLISAAALFIIYIFLSQPSFSGNSISIKTTSFDSLGRSFEGPVEYFWLPSHSHVLGVRLSGEFEGRGFARVFADNGKEKRLIFDSSKPAGSFQAEILSSRDQQSDTSAGLQNTIPDTQNLGSIGGGGNQTGGEFF